MLASDATGHLESISRHEGRTVILRLFTTDMTSTPKESAAFHGQRRSIETDIKSVKQTLGMDQFSTRSVDMVEKEILLGMVAYNLVIHVRRLAARRARVEPRQLSFGRIAHLVQTYCCGLGSAKTVEEIRKRFEKLLVAAGQCRLPVRKKHRSNPRVLMPRRRRFPEKKRA